jgi:hypothetical protein
MSPPQVVGTDLVFGLVLAVIGGLFHWQFGAINNAVLLQLLMGGVPGVLAGCAFARVVPAHRLRTVVALIAIFAGAQLVWNGARSILAARATAASQPTPQTLAASKNR